MKIVALRVAKWGNSLAVRLPVDYVRQANLLDGDTLLLTQGPDGTLALTPGQKFDRAAFARKLRRRDAKVPLGESTIEKLRRGERY